MTTLTTIPQSAATTLVTPAVPGAIVPATAIPFPLRALSATTPYSGQTTPLYGVAIQGVHSSEARWTR